jgi:putative ABC transport system permease protein
VANLTLERSLGRQKEIAIRAAIGAGRARSVQPLAWECLVVALMGGAVGMAASVWVTEALTAIAPSTIPGVRELGVDLRVLTFTAVVSLVTGLVFTLAPALTAARLDLIQCLRDRGPGRDRPAVGPGAP